MKKRFLILFAIFLFIFPSLATAETYIGTYEISYTYNNVYDTAGLDRPIGAIEYNSVMSAPVKVVLAPGTYYTKFVQGRITGNNFHDYGYAGYKEAYDDYVLTLNPGAEYPAMGYNGGNTDPLHNDPANGWWYMVDRWVGSSETDGILVGSNFEVKPGESLWLYWSDPYLYDNLGGVTVEVWQTAAAPSAVPEPATMFLLGIGLAGVAFIKRRYRK